jgi:lipoic acid synthetase
MDTPESVRVPPRKPVWLKRRLPSGPVYGTVCQTLGAKGLHTVCQEARCPNQWECFSRQTATFLILGARCTRNCRFCAVESGPPAPYDPGEPERLADAAEAMGLTYVVVTSVTRDDLPDGGAEAFVRTVGALRQRLPGVRVEILVPDFGGDPEAWRRVVAAAPDVLNHNLETVPRLYPRVRPGADFHRSLGLLAEARRLAPGLATKSGLMLGLGETPPEIEATLVHLRRADCRMLTLGQYLQPTPAHLPVERFVTPEEFEAWHRRGRKLGFAHVASGPLVRSSYHARELFEGAAP